MNPDDPLGPKGKHLNSYKEITICSSKLNVVTGGFESNDILGNQRNSQEVAVSWYNKYNYKCFVLPLSHRI